LVALFFLGIAEAGSVGKKTDALVVWEKVVGSFDFVRLSAHCAQDDSGWCELSIDQSLWPVTTDPWQLMTGNW